ncbi:MAG: glycosyltransferase [Pseudomonadota bacterium]
MPTGIDRVERAYLRHLLSDNVPLFGLVRTRAGYLLVDGQGLAAFLQRLKDDGRWPRSDLLSRLGRDADTAAQAETFLRRHAVARALPPGLPRLLRRRLPPDLTYFNVGHSNLTARVLNAMYEAGVCGHVMIHDVIPLLHPCFQREGTEERFRAALARVSEKADRIIYTSRDTQTRTEPYLRQMGRVPSSVVAHLGVELVEPDLGTSVPSGPYFVTVGTIEPRKNHRFLLDLWSQLGPDPPKLLICGTRGWRNEDVFAALDALPAEGPVKVIQGLTDPALARLMQCSAGLLFPSLAEGFGYPPLEAAGYGTRVLCNTLPVLREVLGKKVDFVSVNDSQSWLRKIQNWARTHNEAEQTKAFHPPTWADHFNTVLR